MSTNHDPNASRSDDDCAEASLIPVQPAKEWKHHEHAADTTHVLAQQLLSEAG